jgi:hypothetical protein
MQCRREEPCRQGVPNRNRRCRLRYGLATKTRSSPVGCAGTDMREIGGAVCVMAGTEAYARASTMTPAQISPIALTRIMFIGSANAK